ncbi:MAG: cytochrome P450 [Bryobacteraceae bacterium]
MKKPPGPRGLDVLGFFGKRTASSTLGFLQKTARDFGPLSYFRILHQHTYLVNDSDLIKEILVVQQHRFQRDVGATVLRELVGDGVLTLEEPRHRERRRILQPAFHRDQIASYVEIIGNESKRLLPGWQNRTQVDMGEEMRRLTLSIIGSSLFGPDFRDSAAPISAVLGRVMKGAGRIAPFVTFVKPVTRSYRRLAPKGPSLFFPSERKELDAVLQPLIDRKRCSDSKDVLSLLLGQTEGELDDEDIRNEMVAFVLAGHETTATALTWACDLLAAEPAMQARLADEAQSVLGDRTPTPDDLPRLRYASLVLNETLRLYPPVPLFGRRVHESVTLAGYELPVRSTVLLSPYVTQRDPRNFEDPEEFRPERWEAGPGAFPKFAFFPFGGGAKMCIGEPLARTEGVLILAELMRRYQFASVSGTRAQPTARVTLRPAQPVLLTAQLRERAHAQAATAPDHREGGRYP